MWNLCEQAYEKLGFVREKREYRPHLTVGRVREDRSEGRLRSAARSVHIAAAEQQVDAIRVVQSRLLPRGAEYATLATCPLKGTD